MDSTDVEIYEDAGQKGSQEFENERTLNSFGFSEFSKEEKEVEKQLKELLESISKETSQLSKFLEEEDRLIRENCNLLKQVLKKLNLSFNIQPKKIPIKANLKKVILDEDCRLILVYEKGGAHSAFLNEYPSEIVTATFLAIMPELAKGVMSYRKKVGASIGFFENVKRELENILKFVRGRMEKLKES